VNASVTDVIRRSRLLLFAPTFLGLVCVGLALSWLATTAEFIIYARETVGKVTALDQELGNNNTWDVTFTFTDSTGAHYTRKTRLTWTTCPPFTTGDPVSVLYIPSSPNRSSINSFATLWFPPLGLAAFGAFFTSGGLTMTMILKAATRQQRAAESSPAAHLTN
jgi:uncharacterized protein DUF3592